MFNYFHDKKYPIEWSDPAESASVADLDSDSNFEPRPCFTDGNALYILMEGANGPYWMVVGL